MYVQLETFPPISAGFAIKTAKTSISSLDFRSVKHYFLSWRSFHASNRYKYQQPEMSCFCVGKTLRLFIRNVAQVDFSASTIHSTPRQIQRDRFRRFSTRAVQWQQQGSVLHDYHESSDSFSQSDGQSLAKETSQHLTELQDTTASKDNPESSTNTSEHGKYGESTFEEFSMGALDSIAEESRLRMKAQREVGISEVIPVAEDRRAFGKSSFRERTGGLGRKSTLSKERRRPEKFDSGRRSGVDQDLSPENEAADSIPTRFRSTRLETTNTVQDPKPLRAPLDKVRKFQEPRLHRDGENATKQDDWVPPKREKWQIQKAALKEKFPEGWKPMKKLSPEAQAGIRALHAQMPDQYTTARLAADFQVAPEAIRRILRAKWQPTEEEQEDRARRWFKRGENVWSRYAELGLKPPRKWRELGIGKGRPSKIDTQALVTRRRPNEEPVMEIEDSNGFGDRIL